MSIEVKELTHIYNEGLPDETLALDNVSFDVEDGQVLCIIGHTGCGKSTLVQHLNGLLKPKSGNIIICTKKAVATESAISPAPDRQARRQDVFDGDASYRKTLPQAVESGDAPYRKTLPQAVESGDAPRSEVVRQDITDPKVSKIEIRKKVGLVFQYPEYQLFEEDVKTDVAFGPKNLGLSEDEIETRVREAISMVGLDYEAVKDVSPFDLSGGQKRRVAVAGVLAMKPEILILDEPVAGLDPKAHREMLELIKSVHKKISSIVILVSHNMDDVAELADKVIVMDRGKVVMQGPPEEIFARSDELTALGLGLPEVTHLMHELKLRGLSISDRLYSYDDAADVIAGALER